MTTTEIYARLEQNFNGILQNTDIDIHNDFSKYKIHSAV